MNLRKTQTQVILEHKQLAALVLLCFAFQINVALNEIEPSVESLDKRRHYFSLFARNLDMGTLVMTKTTIDKILSYRAFSPQLYK